MTPERLTWHLENWAEWMAGDSNDGDYPSRAGSGIGHSNSRDFDTMLAESDTVCARAVQSIVDGLPPRLCITLRIRHGLAEPPAYRLRGDPDDNYAEARVMVGAGLKRRGIV